MNVVALTADYEAWLGRHIPLVRADLEAKHDALAGSPLRFLRGTYYLWLAQLHAALPELVDRPLVPLIGDLHVENFGTWRDAAGVRRWGVSDFDELSWGGYPIDLVRLATSATLVPGIALTISEVCATLLEHWLTADPQTALDVAAAGGHLRALVPKPRTGHDFYAALRSTPAEPPVGVQRAVTRTVAGTWQPSWYTRRAGTGSLGHPRFAGVGADQTGAEQAREAKLLGPLTRDCPGSGAPAGHADDALYGQVHTAVCGPSPNGRVAGWQLRRLAPDVVRIDLAGLRHGDEQRVLRSMAGACADVHGTDRAALERARADCATLGSRWLHDAVAEMQARTLDAHWAWRAR